jgi:polyhydroxyalkanoate synthesis regulator phasin
MSNNMMANLETPALKIPIGTTAHHAAYQLAKLQRDESAAMQVYANTLAVHALNSYFEWLEIDSSLAESESCHPIVTMFSDVADLLLPGLGKIECRLVDQDSTVATIPNVNVDRIGCVVMQMAGKLEDIEEITELEVLGFAQSLAPEISLADLASTEVLLEHLQQLEAQAASSRLGQLIDSLVQRVNLSPEQAAQKLEELYQGSTKIIGSLTYAITEWLDEVLPQGLTQTLVLDRGLDSSTTTMSIDSIDDLALALAEAKLDAISLPVTTPVSSLTTRILELLPRLSIEQLTAKVDELVAEGKSTATNLGIWLEREFQGYSLAPVKSDDSREEQDVTEPMSGEELEAKIKELHKLSHKLVDSWK